MPQIRNRLAWVAIWLALFAGAARALPPQAFVQAGENGQAVLMSRLNECYAITPAHVIGGHFFATLTGGSSLRPRGEADLLQHFGYDLAVLHVTGAVADHCSFDLAGSSALEQRLTTAGSGQVISVNADGSLSRRNVRVSDVGLVYLRVSPAGPDDQLFKGLSGSLLALGDAPAGILMAVDPETGEGKVLRFDRAMETVQPFFGVGSVAPEVPAVAAEVAQAGPDNLAVRVARWSAPAVSAEYRITHLIDAVAAGTVWLARPAGFPIEVVVELSGEQAQAVDRVILIGEGVEPVQRLPRDFELLVSARTDGGWMPVFSGTYFTTDASREVTFAPVRVRRLMLRIYSHWGDATGVGLAALLVPGH